jgi:hypothetical protein
MNLRSSDFVRLFHLRNLLGGLTLLGLAHTVQAEDGIVSTVRGGNLVFAAVSINHSPATWWLVDTGLPRVRKTGENASFFWKHPILWSERSRAGRW